MSSPGGHTIPSCYLFIRLMLFSRFHKNSIKVTGKEHICKLCRYIFIQYSQRIQFKPLAVLFKKYAHLLAAYSNNNKIRREALFQSVKSHIKKIVLTPKKAQKGKKKSINKSIIMIDPIKIYKESLLRHFSMKTNSIFNFSYSAASSLIH